MNIRGIALLALVFFLACLHASLVQAAAALTKLTVTSGSASERDGVLYVAQDQGLFRKYGLDLTFVQVRNGPVAMSALSSGETQFHWGSVSGANLGAIAEGAGAGTDAATGAGTGVGTGVSTGAGIVASDGCGVGGVGVKSPARAFL